MTDQEKHDLVLTYLNSEAASDQQIIDMLLLLLDDWEVRAAVMRAHDRRRSVPGWYQQEPDAVPQEIGKAARRGDPSKKNE